MDTRKTRFLLIGCGGITHAHLPAFAEYPDRIQLIAACDPSKRAREDVATRVAAQGSIRQYTNHEEAIAEEREQVDAALITTPHFLHFPQAKACVEAGIPVLVEKPVCNNLTEALQLKVLSEDPDILVVAGQNRRYERQALWLKQWTREYPEAFGQLRSFDLYAFQNIRAWIATKPDKSADFWILDKHRSGGGVVISLLIHYLDMIRSITNLDYTGVSASGRFDDPFKNGAESSCSARLTMSNGAVGTLHANYLAPRVKLPGEGFTLIGSNGLIRKEEKWEYSTMSGEEPRDWDWQYEAIKEVPEEPSIAPHTSSFFNQLLAFAEAVQNGTRPMNHLGENLNTMATIEAIYTSMNNGGKTVIVPSLQPSCP